MSMDEDHHTLWNAAVEGFHILLEIRLSQKLDKETTAMMEDYFKRFNSHKTIKRIQREVLCVNEADKIRERKLQETY